MTCVDRCDDELLVGSRLEDIMDVATRVWQGMFTDGLIQKVRNVCVLLHKMSVLVLNVSSTGLFILQFHL